ncbi:MAG: DUF1833 domain-containing protein [Rhodobacteraceae bacterium]|nr:DUF1833 domain-containing protein [Paracoccaceae bacterium]MBR9823741.1 DUF1833 domain-containing protein [Paracoccaceae bacterium]
MTVERTLPPAARQDLEAAQGEYAYLGFLTIRHSRLDAPLRLVSDHFRYVYDGDLYIGLPFEWTVVTDNDRPPEARLVVQNVDRRIGRALRQLNERAQLSLVILSSGDFDLSQDPRQEIGTAAIVYAYAHFELSGIEANVIEVSGRVELYDPSSEPFPVVRATEDRCPGLFR